MSDYEAWTPEPDVEQQKKETDEQLNISSSVAILQEFLTDLDTEIEALRGVDIIAGINPSTDPQDLLKAVLANQTARNILINLKAKYQVKYSPQIERPADD